MSRRARNIAILDTLPPLAAVFILGFSLVPEVRTAALWIGVALLGLLVLFVFSRLWRRKVFRDESVLNAPKVSGFEIVTTAAPVESVSATLHRIDWFQFEKLISAIYQAKGYLVKRVGGGRPDGGVDLFIERDDTKTVVQCKHWKSWVVQVRNIREFLGTLTDQQISNGIFVTIRGYTNEAKDLAAKHHIAVLDLNDLIKLMDEVGWRSNPAVQSILNDQRKWCPKCERELVLRVASKGRNAGNQFWGCSGYPQCRFTLNVS